MSKSVVFKGCIFVTASWLLVVLLSSPQVNQGSERMVGLAEDASKAQSHQASGLRAATRGQDSPRLMQTQVVQTQVLQTPVVQAVASSRPVSGALAKASLTPLQSHSFHEDLLGQGFVRHFLPFSVEASLGEVSADRLVEVLQVMGDDPTVQERGSPSIGERIEVISGVLTEDQGLEKVKGSFSLFPDAQQLNYMHMMFTSHASEGEVQNLSQVFEALKELYGEAFAEADASHQEREDMMIWTFRDGRILWVKLFNEGEHSVVDGQPRVLVAIEQSMY